MSDINTNADGIGGTDGTVIPFSKISESDMRQKAKATIALLLSGMHSVDGGKGNAIDLITCLRVFHSTYKQVWHIKPTHMDIKTALLRKELINEEVNAELLDHLSLYLAMLSNRAVYANVDALLDSCFIDLVDDCVDTIFVVVGTLVSMGVDLAPMFGEVFASNMSKLGVDGQPIFREDGKVLKGPNYFKPDLKSLVGEIEPNGKV